MKMKYIGKVSNQVNDLVDDNWGKVESKIILEKQYSDGLKGIIDFSHAIIIFYMDKSDFNIDNDLVRKPRGRNDLSDYGIFAQRAKHRPNPIGITTVKIMELKDNIITVSGLDAVNNTPILDIKPYFKVFDKIENTIQPDWVDDIMQDYF